MVLYEQVPRIVVSVLPWTVYVLSFLHSPVALSSLDSLFPLQCISPWCSRAPNLSVQFGERRQIPDRPAEDGEWLTSQLVRHKVSSARTSARLLRLRATRNPLSLSWSSEAY